VLQKLLSSPLFQWSVRAPSLDVRLRAEKWTGSPENRALLEEALDKHDKCDLAFAMPGMTDPLDAKLACSFPAYALREWPDLAHRLLPVFQKHGLIQRANRWTIWDWAFEKAVSRGPKAVLAVFETWDMKGENWGSKRMMRAAARNLPPHRLPEMWAVVLDHAQTHDRVGLLAAGQSALCGIMDDWVMVPEEALGMREKWQELLTHVPGFNAAGVETLLTRAMGENAMDRPSARKESVSLPARLAFAGLIREELDLLEPSHYWKRPMPTVDTHYSPNAQQVYVTFEKDLIPNNPFWRDGLVFDELESACRAMMMNENLPQATTAPRRRKTL
jgi:hypothetical protein